MLITTKGKTGMTETVAPENTAPVGSTETAATPTPAEPKFDVSTLDEFGQQAVSRLDTYIVQRNELVGKVKAAGGDMDSLIDEIKTGDSDPKVVAVNQKIAELEQQLANAQTALNDYATQKAKEKVSESGADLAALNAEADALDAKIKSSIKYLDSEFGPAVKSALTPLTPRKGRANPAKSGGESGQKRIRGVDVYVDNTHAVSKDAKGIERSNFAAGAKLAGIDTRALQEAYWTAAGTRDVNTLADGHVARFTVTDGEGKTHEVSVTKLSKEQTPQNKDEAAA